jgi:hypothetical protein
LFEIIDNQVVEVEEIKTNTQVAIVKTFYDMQYHTRLTYDAATSTVIAQVYNYLDNQNGWVGNVIFEMNGATISVATSNGSASVQIDTTVAGEHKARTINGGVRNGEVIFNV